MTRSSERSAGRPRKPHSPWNAGIPWSEAERRAYELAKANGKVCRRCGKTLKRPEAQRRGYSDRCWELFVRSIAENNPALMELKRPGAGKRSRVNIAYEGKNQPSVRDELTVATWFVGRGYRGVTTMFTTFVGENEADVLSVDDPVFKVAFANALKALDDNWGKKYETVTDGYQVERGVAWGRLRRKVSA